MAQEQTHPPSPLPYDPAAFTHPWVAPCLLPTTVYGYPNQMLVGFDNSLIAWSNWLWTHDPMSPHKVPKP